MNQPSKAPRTAAGVTRRWRQTWPAVEPLEARALMSVSLAPGLLATPPAVGAVSASALRAPVNVAAQMYADTSKGTATVAVFWTDSDTGISGFNIYRSTDGGTFLVIGQSKYGMYTDATAAPDTKYQYKVAAVGADGGLSPFSKVATIVTSPGVPTAVVGVAENGTVKLSWTETDAKATGYTVLRSADGQTFKPLATIKGNSNTRFVDTSAGGQDVWFYQVYASGPGGVSGKSRIVQVRVPPVNASAVSIRTRFGNELVVTGGSGSDTIVISQTGTMLSISTNGVVTTRPMPAGGLFIYPRGASDHVTFSGAIVGKVTVEAINGTTDTITGATVNFNIWCDSADAYTGAGTVHRVSRFAGGVTSGFGESLPNPAGGIAFTPLNLSLFGTGPVAADALQGQAGDCYLIATLASMANTSPAVLTSSMVDMGDGTYTVQFTDGNSPQYVRVSNQFPTAGVGITNLYYAAVGASGTLWAPVFEKAFAYFRRGENTYASLNGGYFGEVYASIGVNWGTFNHAAMSDADLFKKLSSQLGAGHSVGFATTLNPQSLVRAHAYSLLSVTTVKGVNMYTVRNPWGFKGSSLENAKGIAVMTYAQLCANFAGGTSAVA